MPAAVSPSPLHARTAGRTLDRVSARAVWLAEQGRFDPRDLSECLPPRTIRRQDQSSRLEPNETPDVPARYRLGTMLASRVYASMHPTLGVPVVVKFASPARIAVEHQALTEIAHRNVIRVWDAGPSWIALEFAARGSLTTRKLTPRTIVKLASSIAAALKATLAAGYTHGDVKPSNVLVTAAGVVKLADFGVASQDSHEDTVRGSWAWMAPERFHGVRRPASDLYSLGLMLHGWLTGTNAVTADSFTTARLAHQTLNLEPVHWLVSGVPRELSELIRRLTAKHAEDRPDVTETLAQLKRIRS